MGEITIQFEDILKRMEETFMETLKEMSTDKYTKEKEEEVRNLIRKSIENSSYDSFINAICLKMSDQIIEMCFGKKEGE